MKQGRKKERGKQKGNNLKEKIFTERFTHTNQVKKDTPSFSKPAELKIFRFFIQGFFHKLFVFFMIFHICLQFPFFFHKMFPLPMVFHNIVHKDFL